MKLKLLFLSLLGTITMANAQYTLTGQDGAILIDGYIIEVGENSLPDAQYEFTVTNDNQDDDIYLRAEYAEARNANNTNFAEFCFGMCLADIPLGQFIPGSSPETFMVPAGETTFIQNHFYSDDAGNGTDMVEFVFKFRQYQADGLTEIGAAKTVTYRYNPTLGVKNNNKLDLVIESTIITNTLDLKVNEPMNMVIYDLKGRIVKQANLEVGRQQIDMSNLSTQAYLLQFKNEKGGTQSTKVIVK